MKKLMLLLVSLLLLLSLAACGEEETAAESTETPKFSTPVGKVEAVVPEEGDIAIEITP